MKLLVLSPYPETILPALYGRKDEVVCSNEMPGNWPRADWIVSFGYRHVIGRPTLAEYPDRIINIHVSYLPWNRGADPNFWSWFDDTKKGVSVHLVDKGVDTGPLFGVSEVLFAKGHTLRTSYEVLRQSAILYFAELWPEIRNGALKPYRQWGKGSYHKSSDKDTIFSQLVAGYDTPVEEIESLGRQHRGPSV